MADGSVQTGAFAWTILLAHLTLNSSSESPFPRQTFYCSNEHTPTGQPGGTGKHSRSAFHWIFSVHHSLWVHILSCVASSLLLGAKQLISHAETYLYFSRFPKDSVWTKLTVCILTLVDQALGYKLTPLVSRQEFFGEQARQGVSIHLSNNICVFSALDTTTSALSASPSMISCISC